MIEFGVRNGYTNIKCDLINYLITVLELRRGMAIADKDQQDM